MGLCLAAVPVPASASFHILVIEQTDDGRKFNRGKLLNAGFDMARDDYDVFVFHDVDLLPGVSEPYRPALCSSIGGTHGRSCWWQDELGELYATEPTAGPMHIARVWDRCDVAEPWSGDASSATD